PGLRHRTGPMVQAGRQAAAGCGTRRRRRPDLRASARATGRASGTTMVAACGPELCEPRAAVSKDTGPSAMLARMAATSSHTAYPSEVYESFDAFMQQVIKDTYERGAKRPEFVALVLASGELLPMAWGKMRKSGIRELAVGVGGVVAL